MNLMENYIERACDPSLYQPDLALNMEICDLINHKEKSYPRDAAVAIVRLVNHRNTNVGLLALALLDNCVKNCGYPFHLQIGTKEFLNELVKRFPERMPPVLTPIQRRVLELIQEWKSTICVTSRHKEDLRHIDDMYRLLSFKGYRFPNVSQSATAVLAPSQQIKSPEELEEEDRKAKSAKLQELIRRGTPADLEQANELMKVMAGYDVDKRPDYKRQASEELDNIQNKAMQLSDTINKFPPGKKIEDDADVKALVALCQSNQPKLQKMISEDEGENLERLLMLNDVINQVLESYELAKRGNRTAPAATNDASPTRKSEGVKTQSSLIDFDFGADAAPSSNRTNSPQQVTPAVASPSPNYGAAVGNLMDDLAGLSFTGPTTQQAPLGMVGWGVGGALALGSTQVPNSYQAPTGNFSQSPGPGLGGGGMGTPGCSLPTGTGSPMQGWTPLASGTASPAGGFAASPAGGFGGFTSGGYLPAQAPVSNPAAPLNFSTQQPLQSQQQQNYLNMGAPSTPSKTSPNIPPRSVSPGIESGTMFDGFQSSPPVAASSQTAQHEAKLFDKTGLCVTLTGGSIGVETVQLTAKFKNSLSVPITELSFQVAVPKTQTLKLSPLSSQTVQPAGANGPPVTQAMQIVKSSKEEPIRLRYKITYKAGAVPVNEQGEFSGF